MNKEYKFEISNNNLKLIDIKTCQTITVIVDDVACSNINDMISFVFAESYLFRKVKTYTICSSIVNVIF